VSIRKTFYVAQLALTPQSSWAAPLVAAFSGFTPEELPIDRDAKQEELSGASFGKVTDFSSILRTLATIKARDDLLGRTPEEMALVEERLSICQKKFNSPASVQALLPRLNRDLLHLVFLVNNRLTIADLAVFAAVQPYVSRLDASQKQSLIDICRWYDFIQHLDEARTAGLPIIDLFPAAEIFSSIVSEHQLEQKKQEFAAVVAHHRSAPVSNAPLSSLPEGKTAPYPDGPKPSFGFAFISASDKSLGEGLYVTQLIQGGAAAKAGLQDGDIVTSVDGRPVKDHRDFFAVFLTLAPGRATTFKVNRDGKVMDLQITPGATVSTAAPSAEERKAAAAAEAGKQPKEKVEDAQKKAKKFASKQGGSEQKAESKEAKAEAPKPVQPQAPAAAASSSSSSSSSSSAAAGGAAGGGAPAASDDPELTRLASLIREKKAAGAPKAEVDELVSKLLARKAELGLAVDDGKKKKKK